MRGRASYSFAPFARRSRRSLSHDVKCFLHISKGEQRRRFEALRRSPATVWRVTKEDLWQHERYNEYLEATEHMLTETDADYAPWTIVEAHDRRFATLKIFNTVISALERGVAAVGPISILTSRRKTHRPIRADRAR